MRRRGGERCGIKFHEACLADCIPAPSPGKHTPRAPRRIAECSQGLALYHNEAAFLHRARGAHRSGLIACPPVVIPQPPKGARGARLKPFTEQTLPPPRFWIHLLSYFEILTLQCQIPFTRPAPMLWNPAPIPAFPAIPQKAQQRQRAPRQCHRRHRVPAHGPDESGRLLRALPAGKLEE